MGFGVAAEMDLAGMPCFVARCGYTGEDGFEIFVPEKHAVALWQLLTDQPEVMPSGLGARDTLRPACLRECHACQALDVAGIEHVRE